MDTKVVILNGAPRSGKDSAADHMIGSCLGDAGFAHKRYKNKLYELVQCIYNVDEYTFWDMYLTDKEVGRDCFDGLSMRQAMIKVSEEVIKPNFGNDYFGKQLVSDLCPDRFNIVSDGGFVEEVQEVVGSIGAANVMIIRIHRQGCTFENDSRNYLPDGLVDLTVDIDNNGTLEEFYSEVERTIKIFIGEEDD